MQHLVRRMGAAVLMAALALVGVPALADEPAGTAAPPVGGDEAPSPQLTALGEPLPDVAAAPRHMETPTDQIIGGVTIIGRSEIERKGWRNLSQILENVPGLHIVQAGGFGQPVSYFSRGTHSNQTLVLMDGVEIHDPSIWTKFGRDNVEEPCEHYAPYFFDYGCMAEPDEHDLAHIVTDNIERVEIMRGPVATYGSRAVGGVINIVTRKGSGAPAPSAWFEAGAFGTVHSNAALHGGNELVNYSVSYSNLHTRGITALDESFAGAHERDDYRNDTWSARLGLTPADGVEFNLIGRRIEGRYDLDHLDLQGTQWSQWEGVDLSDGERDDLNDYAHTRSHYVRGEMVLNLLDDRWRQRFGVSFTDHDRHLTQDEYFAWVGEGTYGEGDIAQYASDGTRFALDWQNDFFLNDEHTLTVGVETKRESIDITESSSYVEWYEELYDGNSYGYSEVYDGCVNCQHGNMRTSSLFAQHQFNMDDQLLGSLGVRFDRSDEYGTDINYRAAVAYAPPGSGTRLHASLGTANSDPPLPIMFGQTVSAGVPTKAAAQFRPSWFVPAFRGENLEREHLRGFEVGAQQTLMEGKVRAGSSYFWSRGRNIIELYQPYYYNDSIDYKTANNYDGCQESPVFYRNQAKTRLEGFESFVSYVPNERMLMRIDHTLLTAEDRSTDMDLLSRPRHQVNASLEVRPLEKATLSTTLRYVGRRKDLVDDSVPLEEYTSSSGLRRTTLGGFAVVNLAGTYQLADDIKLFGRIDNLFNRDYEDTDPWNSRGFSGYVGIRGSY